MKIINKILKVIFRMFIIVLIGGILASNFISYTFSAAMEDSPNVLITINSDGSIVQKGNLFTEELYPISDSNSKKDASGINGVIRIKNEFRDAEVDRLAVGINNMAVENGYSEDVVFNSFLKNVKLKIEKGTMLSFNKVLVDYTSIENLLLKSGDEKYRGYILDSDNKFSINKGDAVDLKYSMYMDSHAGNELQSITAYIPVFVNFKESHIIDDDDNNDRGSNIGDTYEEEYGEDVIQIEDNPIPLDSEAANASKGSGSSTVTSSGALPNTGYVLNTTVLLIIGVMITGTGFVLTKKM